MKIVFIYQCFHMFHNVNDNNLMVISRSTLRGFIAISQSHLRLYQKETINSSRSFLLCISAILDYHIIFV